MTWKPTLYDYIMKNIERPKLKRARQQLIQKARGHVLEIGSGIGANFPLYEHAKSVDAIEPDTLMMKRSLWRKKQATIPNSHP